MFASIEEMKVEKKLFNWAYIFWERYKECSFSNYDIVEMLAEKASVCGCKWAMYIILHVCIALE